MPIVSYMDMRLKIVVAGFSLAISLAILWSSFSNERVSYLRVDFLDVDQGDAILVTSPSGIQMLIDAGKDRSVLRALGDVMDFSDRKIDVVVATHPDADHIGGFPDVFDRYDVDLIVGVNASSGTKIYENFKTKVAGEDANTINAERGMTINFGAGVLAQVLFPYADTTITGNDASVIIKIIYEDAEVLLTGDAGRGVEEHLVLLERNLLESDILKVGHHGSKTSTSQIFLETVKPIISIISAGENNRYGHPHGEVTNLLTSVGVPYVGTYKEGTVTLLSDGQKVWRK